MEGGGRGWTPSSPAEGRGRCRTGQWETSEHSWGDAAQERESLSPQPSLLNPSHVLTVTEPSSGNRRWRCPNFGLEYPPFPEMGTRGSKQGGGILAALPRGPVGLRHQVSLSVSSCSPPGKPRWGEGRGRGGGHLTFGSTSPSLSGFLAGGKGGLPLLTLSLPEQGSVSVGGEGPGLTAVQGWVGMAGPGAGPALASNKEAPLQPSARAR